MRTEKLFNDNWEFIKLDFGTELNDFKNIENTQLSKVTLPHDWLIYNTLDLYEDSTGWYRKNFNVSKDDNRRFLLNFDGVYMDSTVYVNEMKIGTHHYGYSCFEYDITDALADGNNEIIVQVRHKGPNSRWYSGAGIYRDVVLKEVPLAYITSDGVYVSAKNVKGQWLVTVDVEVENADKADNDLSLDIELLGDNKVSDFKIEDMTGCFIIDNPKLWYIDNPYLYDLKVSLIKDSKKIDEVSVKFGLRDIKYTTDNGFLLNGSNLKLKGVCEHHDLGCLGAAFNKDAMRRKMLILKNMGVNAIRTSHNMPARGLLELADEMGMLIDSESFDMWRHPKTEFDYARFFNEDSADDVRSWVMAGRNHPCVIMWSIGNEIYDCHADEDAPMATKRLKELVEKYDYRHNAPVTHGSNYMAWEGAQKCTDELKLAGYNYGEKLYDEHHEKYKDWMIYGSETCSTVQSRGIYHFPMSVSVMADDDEQCSGLGNCTTSWGAENVEYVIKAERDHAFSAGQFLWSGFDYIGEPTPYHTKNSYFGQIDTAGFPKDTYYIFKAEWTDASKDPFVHVFPYWDFNEGQQIDVRIATNLPACELIVNGISQGIKKIDHAHGAILCPTYQVEYHKGYIEAIGYDEDGNIIAKDRRNSFTDANELKVKRFDFKNANVNTLFYEIYAVDKDQNEVENADLRVNVEVINGTLLGLDNGDSTDFEQYKGNSRKLFGNRLLAVVKPDEGIDFEDVIIKVTSPELEDNTNKEPAINSYGIDTNCEIPIRKLEIISKEGNKLTPLKKSITLEAKVYPSNASYNDITWLAVNDYAVKSNLVAIESEGNKCKITAKGDGKFNIRCMTKNGTDKYKCISTLSFVAEGLGTAYYDPYDFIAGSLYTDSKGDIGNGNEKGVATSRLNDSYVGYDNLDFGEFGSDEITLPIFTLDDNEYMLQIWEGRPGAEGSELLCDGRYCKKSIWNVYQEETYKLNRRVKGITSIYFKANAKYHIKGFSFKKPDKAFETIYASENSRIYGDTFTISDKSILGIGNNVTIEFDDMNFGERKAQKVYICGNSPIEVNTIHIKVDDALSGESNTYLIEFEHSDGNEERCFKIPAITGNTKVGLIFLPGCNFDLEYFRFE